MATKKKSTRKAAPARRTPRKPAQPKTVDPISPEERGVDTPDPSTLPGKDQGRDKPLAQLVDITPLNRVRDGYREMDVVAVNPGTFGGKPRKRGEPFRIGVIGDGPLPPSVRAA
jgi:hypothetical protein